MNETHLIMTLPHGEVTATSLGIDGFARHRSPGSGKNFRGRRILVDLAVEGGEPAFRFLDEGGWRDPVSDSVTALAAVRSGKRTKTALSNSAFNCVPLTAYRDCYLVKTGGATLALALGDAIPVATYLTHVCHEELTTEEVARAIGRPFLSERTPRLYMVLCPIQFFMLSNLTPEEYAWYATHRPGKLFRHVMFAEIRTEQGHIAAQSRFEEARRELRERPSKKTKTIVFEDCLNQIPFEDWVGYRREATGGLYAGDRNSLTLRPFPEVIPHSWERAAG